MALRQKANGETLFTDGGNVILDAKLGRISNPAKLADALDHVTGLVEHGLFIGMAERAILATSTGIRTVTL